jgi:hypothetical protein
MNETRFVEQMKKVAIKYYNDPVGYAKVMFDINLSDQEKQIANAIAKYDKVSVRSGHHTGKDTTASVINWWFLGTRFCPKVICSANTKEQLYDVLWAEMAKWKRKSPVLDLLYEWTKEKIFHKGFPAEWWSVARSASKGEGIQGRHATTEMGGKLVSNQLIILDEVSGMDEEILAASEGIMSGKGTKVLMISNPTRNSGFFYRTHTPKGKKHWHTIHLSSLDSPFAGKEWIEYMKDMYGENSNIYRVRVLGDFPVEDKDSLIPLSWVNSAVNKPIYVSPIEPLVFGVDVGGGGDRSVILHRRGGKVERIRTIDTQDTMELVGWIGEEALEFEPDAICIDPIQIGNGPYYRLKELGFRVYPVDYRRVSKKKRFRRIRDELCWKARTLFQDGMISIPEDDELVLEASSVKYKPDSGGLIKIEDKYDLIRRLKWSPDKFDAFCISLKFNDKIFVKEHPSKYKFHKKVETVSDPEGWMAV